MSVSFLLSISGNSSENLHCGSVVNMPYCHFSIVFFYKHMMTISLLALIGIKSYECKVMTNSFITDDDCCSTFF